MCPEYVPRIGTVWHAMRFEPTARPQPVSGHVFRVERKRGPQWYAKYRLQDGRQVQRRIGPAWTERGRPPTGYFTKRKADAWLRDLLDQARRGADELLTKVPSEPRMGLYDGVAGLGRLEQGLEVGLPVRHQRHRCLVVRREDDQESQTVRGHVPRPARLTGRKDGDRCLEERLRRTEFHRRLPLTDSDGHDRVVRSDVKELLAIRAP